MRDVVWAIDSNHPPSATRFSFTMEDISLEIQNESIMADVFCDQDQLRSIKIN